MSHPVLVECSPANHVGPITALEGHFLHLAERLPKDHRLISEERTRLSHQRIVVSPYLDEQHLLDLDTIDKASQILALALTYLRCLKSDYATTPYLDVFNWDEIVTHVRNLSLVRDHVWKEKSFYVVAFRSIVNPQADYASLGALDKAAHAEATASGGFLKYWFGSPNDELRNLATCIWTSEEDAVNGARGQAHRKAALAARSAYESWHIERYRFLIRDGASDWSIEEW